MALLFKHTQFEGKRGVTLKDLKRRAEIDVWLFAKLAGENAESAKPSEPAQPSLALPEQCIESYNLVLEKHHSKPESVRAASEQAIAKLATDMEAKDEFMERQEKFFNEVDEDKKGILNWEQYKMFRKKQDDWEAENFGGSNNYSEEDMKVLFEHT